MLIEWSDPKTLNDLYRQLCPKESVYPFLLVRPVKMLWFHPLYIGSLANMFCQLSNILSKKFLLPYIGDFKKICSFSKSPWTQGLSVIAVPGAWSDAVPCVTSSRCAPGLESASACVSPRRGRLPGERGPRVRRGPAPGGAEACEQ